MMGRFVLSLIFCRAALALHDRTSETNSLMRTEPRDAGQEGAVVNSAGTVLKSPVKIGALVQNAAFTKDLGRIAPTRAVEGDGGNRAWGPQKTQEEIDAEDDGTLPKLGDKMAGFCVDHDGYPLHNSIQVVQNENECWADCDLNAGWQACAFHWDTNQCIQYLGPAARGNNWDGFTCRFKPIEKYEMIVRNPCLETCPNDAVPTCSTFETFVAPGGCAQYCSAAVKAKFHVYICGKKPECAETCDEDFLKMDTCDAFTAFTKTGGCAATCSEALKLEFHTELCPFVKPACAATCTDLHVPTCSTYETFVRHGGCAANCSEAEKHHYAQFVCGRKPLCAVSCPEDVAPTCETVETFTGAGGCAITCSDQIKADFKHEVCNGDVSGWHDHGGSTKYDEVEHKGYERPPCASSCVPFDQAQKDFASPCAMYEGFTKDGGCMESCSSEVKDTMKEHACERNNEGFRWGEEGNTRSWKVRYEGYTKPPCASSCQAFDEAQKVFSTPCAMYESFTKDDGCMASCTQEVKDKMKEESCERSHEGFAWGEAGEGHTIEEEEAVLKKFDDIVAGAESEASLPDSRHTTPEPQEDDEESNKSTYMCIAFVLVSLCACWSYAGFAFHRWALSPKKELLVETEGESEAEAS